MQFPDDIAGAYEVHSPTRRAELPDLEEPTLSCRMSHERSIFIPPKMEWPEMETHAIMFLAQSQYTVPISPFRRALKHLTTAMKC